MKNLIRGSIFTVLTGIVSFYVYRYLSPKVDLVYNLSEEFPSTFVESDRKEIMQQLFIKNNGGVEAEKIVIKINTDINDYIVRKYSESDEITVSKGRDYFELVYPSLPTLGEIKLFVKSSGIDKAKVQVLHNKGTAREAFETSSNLSFWFHACHTPILISIQTIADVCMKD